VPRGAGTGLSGGARPIAGGAILGTARMRDILEVNETDRYARVQAGVVNAHLTGACHAAGLFYAPEPSSQTACTIGGNVGNNSGGPHGFRYGSTTTDRISKRGVGRSPGIRYVGRPTLHVS
jgi:glycolate oxidase